MRAATVVDYDVIQIQGIVEPFLTIWQVAMVRQHTSDKQRSFTVKVVLPFDEKIEISDVCPSMSVLDLKDRLELAIGIPR